MKYSEYYAGIASSFDDLRLDRAKEIGILTENVSRRLGRCSAAILDVGCGTGRYGSMLSRLGYRVFGIDASFEQLAHAQKGFPRACALCTELPFGNGTFAGLLAVMMIHQLSSRTRQMLWRAAHGILYRDGLVWIKTCSHDDLKNRPLGQYFPSALSINLSRYPDTPALEEELADAQFDVVEVTPTQSDDRIPTEQLLQSVEQRHNTTMALLPQDEFKEGLARLRRECDGRDYLLSHHHTIIVARSVG